MDHSDMIAIDQHTIWHPYSPLPGASSRIVVAAQGPYLTLQVGSTPGETITVIDAMSSWWAAAFGYRHPRLDAAAHTQIDTFSHVMFGGLTHRPAIELARKLVALTPAPLSKVFFCDSGSVSVEVAVKMALQYWRAHHTQEGDHKTRLLTWRGGYHGDTFTPMSVCDPEGGMHTLWQGVVWPQVFLPCPPAHAPTSLGGDHTSAAKQRVAEEEYLRRAEEVIVRHQDELAACIIEPVVQGAGGMRFHSPELVRRLTEICHNHNILVIYDEIATGFGRTGTMFAADATDSSPDIMCVGKALTGGYLTSAAVLTTDHLAQTISEGTGALMHGPTFMANPLACAVASVACDLAVEAVGSGEARRIEKGLRHHLQPLVGHPGVRDVRVCGAIGVVELEVGGVGDEERTISASDYEAMTQAALDAGVWIRPFRNLVYCMPPFVCTDDDIATICQGMIAATQTAVSVWAQ